MKKINKKYTLITTAGIAILIILAFLCYQNVKHTIIENEQRSMLSIAKFSAESLEATIAAKEDKIYSVFAGDIESVEQGLIRMQDKGRFIPEDQMADEDASLQEALSEARENPGQVTYGPMLQGEDGSYHLNLMKTVSKNGVITGLVCFECNLDELYKNETVLTDLQLSSERYCVILDENGQTIMPSEYASEKIGISHQTESGCKLEDIYETKNGTPRKKQKLIAYDTLSIGAEKYTLCILEDYGKVIAPIDRLSLYLCILGLGILAIVVIFAGTLSRQNKAEELLMKELEHEKTLNETMKKQEGLMQKYNHSKTMQVLIGSIAHEFNNLMTPIVLYTDLLRDNEVVMKEMPEEVMELSGAAERCEELARQLLSYNRQGRVERALTDYDATYAVNVAVGMVEKLLPANIVLKTNICKTSYRIHGQVGSLNQILINLATNAVHAMPDGGTLSIQFGLSVEDDENVRLIVEDTGSGIPDKIQNQVFQPFFSTKSTEAGSGIGLTVVRRLVQEHDGDIRVKTKENEGTTFVIDFPRV